MEGIEVATAIQEAIVAHHDAFTVELLGEENSGLPKERILELIDTGFLKRDALEGLKVDNMDIIQFSQRVSHEMNRTPDDERQEKRELSLSQWKQIIDQTGGVRQSSGAPVQLPKPPPTPVTRMAPSGEVTFVREPVDYTPAERASYNSAVKRAGEFARGLGNRVSEQSKKIILEEWDGTQIKLEADPGLRQQMRSVIQDKVSQAVAQRQSARKLASELGNATKDWARDWGRIARTELQAAYNEGVVIESIDIFGDDARVARVPDSGACADCIRLLLDEENKPIIFQVADLLSRGTNVGKRRESWQPTMFPIHPNCKCDIQIVPPGLKFGDDGLLVPED